jgi:large subunit ribosomal protein L29
MSKRNEELRSRSAEDLNKELLQLRRAQFGLRMQMATQSLGKNSEMERVRREIARVHTFLVQQKAKASGK